ncbi:MAG: hypothetical protein ALECFALPRED_009438 [Alectoria fallacina]|uniref:RlpA-like protein double-psi beta-barrel domain-containing protein n=1 Tax=Alectoria fallacina TaxID=1903189 RepID=A0A8H3PIZ5_9LECA|nr:MAG: hypothetical protein ALECFALPRED_009438 [Alectoria fallacina]
MENAKAQRVEEFHLPEWETTARHGGEKDIRHKQSVKGRAFIVFDHVMPRDKKYFVCSRKGGCIAISIFLVLLALILGLAIGLGRKTSQHQNLPLGSQTYTGDLTYYDPGLGACGVTSSDTDHIVSISHFTFDAVSKSSNPNANPLCGHKLRAVRNGNSIDLTVVDRCVGCQATDLDVSPGAFKQLADATLGRVEVTWAWLPPVPTI